MFEEETTTENSITTNEEAPVEKTEMPSSEELVAEEEEHVIINEDESLNAETEEVPDDLPEAEHIETADTMEDANSEDEASITEEFSEEYTEKRIAELKGKIEAALFVTGKPLQLEQLAEIIEADKDLTEMATVELIQDYAFRQDCALEIDDTDGYILQIREEHAAVVNKMMPLELSAAVVRTLSAIAIKSPILQSDLIELRGSTAYDHIGDLLARKLISKRRKGRSFMLATTEHFDQYFKLMGDKKELENLVKQLGKENKPANASDDELGDMNDADFEDDLDQEAV